MLKMQDAVSKGNVLSPIICEAWVQWSWLQSCREMQLVGQWMIKIIIAKKIWDTHVQKRTSEVHSNYSEEYCQLAGQTPFLNSLSGVKAGDGKCGVLWAVRFSAVLTESSSHDCAGSGLALCTHSLTSCPSQGTVVSCYSWQQLSSS